MAYNNYKGSRNNGAKAGGKEPALPRINAKIDRLVDNDTNLRAFASVTVGGAVAIHGLRVMDSKKGLFVSMPSYSYEDHNGETKYADYAHPISKEEGENYSDSEDEESEYGSEDYDSEPNEAPSFRPRM